MILYILFIIIVSFYGCKISLKKNNKKYIDKDNTSAIKGAFILLIIYSHSLSYVQYNDSLSSISNKLIFTLGQLVVAMFLFYSGYGVFEQYKKRGKKYINNFPQRRILKTLVNFDIIVLLYTTTKSQACQVQN